MLLHAQHAQGLTPERQPKLDFVVALPRWLSALHTLGPHTTAFSFTSTSCATATSDRKTDNAEIITG